jgi:hypothetical protein
VSATTIQFGQLPALLLRAPDGAEATITLYGAHLVSWKPCRQRRAGQERLFSAALSALDGSRAIRGGVPVIFPQFAERGSGMRHGFARVSTWRVLDSGEQDGAAFAVLALNPSTWRRRPPRLAARLRTALRVACTAPSWSMTLDVRNTGTQPFPFAAALHTYHLVDDVEACASTACRPRPWRSPTSWTRCSNSIPGRSLRQRRRCADAGAEGLRTRSCGIRARPMRRRWPTWKTRSTGASCASSRPCWGRRCWSRVGAGAASIGSGRLRLSVIGCKLAAGGRATVTAVDP